MKKQKQKFVVKGFVIDDSGYEMEFGTFETWAVSAKQAVNQVRYREGHPAGVSEYGNTAVVFRAY